MGTEEGTALCKIPWGVLLEHSRRDVSARLDLKYAIYRAAADCWQIHLRIELHVKYHLIDM